MRVIPVIDLKNGAAVHAVRGERERYRPLRSELVAGSDPVRVARAVRGALGLDELYVADLDAIAGGPPHRAVVAALAREARVMVDAGVTEVAAVRLLLELGAARVVIGTETLEDGSALERLRAALPDAPLVLSLDLRGGRVLSPDTELARLGAAEALARLAQSGVSEVIVLDVARVGAEAGPDVAQVRKLCASFPELELLAGGGVRDLADLRALAEAGAAGALVATALHGGAIGPDELRALGEGGGRQPTTVSKCSASAAATSTPVARSTPCQPGMPLTSTT
jgi:phosphoribosylformimino-5-aminoimidazole carboxamide ribotide isomerase